MDHPLTVIPAEGAQGRKTQRNIMTGETGSRVSQVGSPGMTAC